MGIDIKDQFKEHKKILLPAAGVIVLVIAITILTAKGFSPVDINNNLPGGNGIDDLINTDTDTMEKPTMQLKTGVDYSAVIKTNKGSITIDLLEKDTPITVNNFVALASQDYFDNLTFHRVIRNFVIQGGDPKGDGTGGPGYKFADEIDADALGLDDQKVADITYLRSFFSESVINQYKNKSVKELYEKELGFDYTPGFGTTKFAPYVVAMANSGPNTNGSQFFITTASFTGDFLNGKHTIFGTVTKGFDVVDAIEEVDVNTSDAPISEVKITDIKIVED